MIRERKLSIDEVNDKVDPLVPDCQLPTIFEKFGTSISDVLDTFRNKLESKAASNNSVKTSCETSVVESIPSEIEDTNFDPPYHSCSERKGFDPLDCMGPGVRYNGRSLVGMTAESIYDLYNGVVVTTKSGEPKTCSCCCQCEHEGKKYVKIDLDKCERLP